MSPASPCGTRAWSLAGAPQTCRVSWQFRPRRAAEPATEVTVCTYKTRLRGFGGSQPTTVGFVSTDRHFSGGLTVRRGQPRKLPTHSARPLSESSALRGGSFCLDIGRRSRVSRVWYQVISWSILEQLQETKGLDAAVRVQAALPHPRVQTPPEYLPDVR